MANIDSFFSLQNTVQKTSNTGLEQPKSYLDAIAAFARTTYKSLYVIDYKVKGFEYVSDNPLFLCGHTAEEVQKMGYAFYLNYVPEQDLKLLLKINSVGNNFYDKLPVKERKAYTISYDFQLKTSKNKQILIHQKLTPLFLTEKGKIWKALCVVSLSSQKHSGNVSIHKQKSEKFFKYSLKTNCWKTESKLKLNARQREILYYSIRSYSIDEIAAIICISPDTVKFHRKKLFRKLNVSTISEAISYATVNGLFP